MENNSFSSTTVIKIDHDSAKTAQYDLPESYGKTESFLLPKDPVWMFLFWDIISATFDAVKSAHGQDVFAQSKSIVRVYDITDIASFDGTNANSYFDIPVVLDAGSWYINAPKGGRKYICDLGIITPSNVFIVLSRSNSTALPPGKMSDKVDEKWMLVEGEYQKLVKMSGAEMFGSTGSSEKLHHFLSQRWKMFEFDISNAPSSHISSWMTSRALASHSLPQLAEDEDIWLKADCELIVYGQASKNANVTIGGKPVQLNADGSFSFRCSLQDGQVVIPIKAQHHTKEEKQRAITIKAQREKEA